MPPKPKKHTSRLGIGKYIPFVLLYHELPYMSRKNIAVQADYNLQGLKRWVGQLIT
jgi:hypothetical protein